MLTGKYAHKINKACKCVQDSTTTRYYRTLELQCSKVYYIQQLLYVLTTIAFYILLTLHSSGVVPFLLDGLSPSGGPAIVLFVRCPNELSSYWFGDCAIIILRKEDSRNAMMWELRGWVHDVDSWDRFRDWLGDGFSDRLCDGLGDCLGDGLGDRLSDGLGDLLGDGLGDRLWNWDWLLGSGTGSGSGYSGTGTGSGIGLGTGSGIGLGTGSGIGLGTGSGIGLGTGTGSGYSGTGTGSGSGYSGTGPGQGSGPGIQWIVLGTG